MKKQAFTVFTFLSLIVTLAVSARAQSDNRIEVNVPFEFAIQDKLLPAGEYTVRSITQKSLMIQSTDCSTAVIFSAIQTQSGTIPDVSKLVFNRYGDQYFLSMIWMAGNSCGHELGKSHAERNLFRVRTTSTNGPSPGQVVFLTARR